MSGSEGNDLMKSLKEKGGVNPPPSQIPSRPPPPPAILLKTRHEESLMHVNDLEQAMKLVDLRDKHRERIAMSFKNSCVLEINKESHYFLSATVLPASEAEAEVILDAFRSYHERRIQQLTEQLHALGVCDQEGA